MYAIKNDCSDRNISDRETSSSRILKKLENFAEVLLRLRERDLHRYNTETDADSAIIDHLVNVRTFSPNKN